MIDGPRTSPHQLSLAMEGPDGPPDCNWQKSAASVGIKRREIKLKALLSV